MTPNEITKAIKDCDSPWVVTVEIDGDDVAMLLKGQGGHWLIIDWPEEMESYDDILVKAGEELKNAQRSSRQA